MTDTVRSVMSYALRFPATSLTATIAVLVTGLAVASDIDLFDLDLGGFDRVTKGELDELVIVWALVFMSYGIDLATRAKRRAKRLQAEQLRVVHVTMRTVQDIVGNCLTELQLLRIHADGVVPPEALAIFDESIRVTSAKLTALGELERFAEKAMAMGSGLDIDRRRG